MKPLKLLDTGSFHVGGRTVAISGQTPVELKLTGTIDAFTLDPNGTYAIEGAYVQYMIPDPCEHSPVLLIHGGGMNGSVWETTPDGRPGWQRQLLEKGYPVYVIDMVERGRAGFCSLDTVWPGQPLMRSLESAWDTFRIGPASNDMQEVFPGQKFPVDFFEHSALAWSPRWLHTEKAAVAALSKAIERIGPTHVMVHSSGAVTAFETLAGMESNLALSLCLIEPAGLPEAKISPDIPVLSVWGDFVEHSVFWTDLYTQSEMVLAALDNRCETLSLNECGLPGHSHLLMQDTGNERVLDVILDRLMHVRDGIT